MLQLTSALPHLIAGAAGVGSSIAPSSPPAVAVGPDTPSRHLVQSPYTEPEHQLDLWTLDREGALVARALAALRAVTPAYAQTPYAAAFNWDDVAAKLRELAARDRRDGSGVAGFRESSYYVVAFRSQIPPETEYEDLGLLDKPAHAEAIASGGFLKYWFGAPDAEGRNLATCIWHSRDHAVRGSKGQWHKRAARATASLYSYWKIERLRLTVREGAAGIDFAEWVD